MEHEVLAAHGASILTREMYSSDNTTIYVCEKCGSLAVEDNIKIGFIVLFVVKLKKYQKLRFLMHSTYY
ncbi:hypothetical protein [Candidatus Nanopusillus massiliensis]|uniref:hypothetical protein n=1 Tax=Candidatus Nanopusillus massiliensis TaxID=2897163 RepID=UPI001E4CC0C0|nr:hypothetical protein [Candidatus Nanopusillus massiliensis]